MKVAPLLMSLLGLTGCSHYFAATGTLASEAGDLGTWHSVPQGCSRGPVDGLPSGISTTVLTFLWNDPAVRDPLRDIHRFTAPNAPLRLEVSRLPATGDTHTFALKLDTVKTEGTRLDPANCTTLNIDTHETAPAIAEGRPTLAGSVQLECSVADSHVTANLRFQRCEY